MEKLGGVVQSKGGRVVIGATIQVFIAGTNTPATVYADRAGVSPLTVVKTDNEGEWGCYAPNGRYDVFTTVNSRRDGQYTDYLLYDPADDTSTGPIGTDPAVTADIATLKGQVVSLNSSVSANSSQVGTLTSSVNANAGQIAANAAQITDLQYGAKDFDTVNGASLVLGIFANGPGSVQDMADADGAYMIGRSTNLDGSVKTIGASLDALEKPAASVVPDQIGQLVIEATSNTQVKLKLMGTDGVVRSVTLTLA